MSVLGNIFLGLAAVLTYFLIISLYAKEAPKGGDAVVGYVWGIIILNLVFLGLMAIVFLVIGLKGGFEWVPGGTGSKALLVSAGLFAAVFTAGMSALSKGGGPEPWLLRAFGSFAPALIPVLLLAGSLILLNDPIRAAVPEALFKGPLYVAALLGFTGLIVTAWSFLQEANQNAIRRMERSVEENKELHQRHLDDIDSCDISKNMVFILVFTDANHAPDVRERALAKIKTHPDWQKEMIRLLECDWAPEAFTFLASNEVDDKARFAEPVRQGVLNQARLILESLRRCSHPSHLYQGQFSWEVERMLRAVDKFQGQGIDYKPAVQEVRNALDEPIEFSKPDYTCKAWLEEWLKKH